MVTGKSPPQRVPLRLYPAVVNGGFEVDLAGDRKPEYWSANDSSGKAETGVVYPLINLDNQVKRGGARSLRLDPCTAVPGAQVDVFPIGTMLFPETTYRFTAWVRVPEGSRFALLGPGAQPLTPVGPPDQSGWQRLERIVTSGSQVEKTALRLSNTGSTPIWVDHVAASIVQ